MFRLYLIRFFEYLLLFLVVIEFNTPYMEFPTIKKAVHIFLLVVLVGLNLFNTGKFKLDSLIVLLLLGAIFPLLNIADGHLTQYIRIYIIFLPLSVLYLTKLFKEGNDKVYALLLKYSNIVIVLAITSLFFWLWGSMLEKIPYTMLIPNSWATGEERLIPTYYGIYFETQDANVISGQMSMVVRNSGIFNEAPMHNMILCVAIAIEVFLRPKLSKMRILILIAAVFSTISTTGFIFLIALLAGKSYMVMNAKRRFMLILFFPLILLFSLFLVSVLLENKKETGETSYNARGSDIVQCIEIGLENPVLGVELFHSNRVGGGPNYGFSNSLFTIFAHGGFYVLTLYLMALFILPLLCYRSDKNIGLLGVMLCYFLLFTFTLSQYKYFTILFMAIGLSYWNVTFHYRKKAKVPANISKALPLY